MLAITKKFVPTQKLEETSKMAKIQDGRQALQVEMVIFFNIVESSRVTTLENRKKYEDSKNIYIF